MTNNQKYCCYKNLQLLFNTFLMVWDDQNMLDDYLTLTLTRISNSNPNPNTNRNITITKKNSLFLTGN